MANRPTMQQIWRLVFDDTNDALKVNLVAGSSGGGTEYTEGDTDASITGTAVLSEGPSNTLTPLKSDASGNVLVSDTASQTALAALLAAVDGLEGFTDGLETLLTSISGFVDGLEGFVDGLESALTGVATESTLQSVLASLSVLDDWDESDRAKVNPIVGSAGVQGGSGTVSANTQRVVLATDVALPAGSNSIGQVTANAGTNLNTSALALESGGNLAGAAASLAVIDDWDESDRAKVNPIAGSAGVQGGAGAVTNNTQRVVIATDQTSIPVTPSPSATVGSLSNKDSTAYEASNIIKASAGKLFTLFGYNSKTSEQFILIFDSAILPAEGTAPTLAPIRVPAQSNFSLDLKDLGRAFSTGIVVCNSSTANTKTIGSSDCWFSVTYL